jgi:hypothetical protein
MHKRWIELATFHQKYKPGGWTTWSSSIWYTFLCLFFYMFSTVWTAAKKLTQ